MTRKEFFEKLAEVKDKFIWTCDDDLRGRIKYKNQHNRCIPCMCPIEAMHYAEYGLQNCGLGAKCEEIGLSQKLAIAIIRASDNYGSERTRKELRKVLGV